MAEWTAFDQSHQIGQQRQLNEITALSPTTDAKLRKRLHKDNQYEAEGGVCHALCLRWLKNLLDDCSAAFATGSGRLVALSDQMRDVIYFQRKYSKQLRA